MMPIQPLRKSWRSRLGPLPLGAICLLLASALAGWLTPHWQEQAAQQKKAALLAKAQRQQQAKQTGVTADLKRQQTLAAQQARYPKLPAAHEQSARVTQLVLLADQNGLQVLRLQQTAAATAGTTAATIAATTSAAQAAGAAAATASAAWVWQGLQMPVRGSYASVRQFVQAALQADPALALQAVSLRRSAASESSAGGAVEAELSWSMASAAAASPAAALGDKPHLKTNPAAQAVQQWADRAEWPALGAHAGLAWAPLATASGGPRVAARQLAAPLLAPDAAASGAEQPTLPYRLMGRITDEGRQRVMLVGLRQTLVVGEQELVDAEWRLERIEPQAVQLRWLPGDKLVRLAFVS
jgi:hypothetical protein